ncbi:hypothetical protein Ancab_001014 [Ancistrocladus abbreviatus]
MVDLERLPNIFLVSGCKMSSGLSFFLFLSPSKGRLDSFNCNVYPSILGSESACLPIEGRCQFSCRVINLAFAWTLRCRNAAELCKFMLHNIYIALRDFVMLLAVILGCS